jgi:hypothetical protein
MEVLSQPSFQEAEENRVTGQVSNNLPPDFELEVCPLWWAESIPPPPPIFVLQSLTRRVPLTWPSEPARAAYGPRSLLVQHSVPNRTDSETHPCSSGNKITCYCNFRDTALWCSSMTLIQSVERMEFAHLSTRRFKSHCIHNQLTFTGSPRVPRSFVCGRYAVRIADTLSVFLWIFPVPRGAYQDSRLRWKNPQPVPSNHHHRLPVISDKT